MGSTSTKLPSLSFSTATLPAPQRFEHWHASLARDFELSLPEGSDPRLLQNDGEVWAVGPLIFGTGRYSTHTLDRPLSRVTSSAIDHYKLHLRLQGEPTLIDADGRRLVVAARQMALTDMARPEKLHRPAGESITLFIAREALDDLLPRPIDLHGVALDGVSSKLLCEHLQVMARQLAELSLPDAQLASAGILNLIAASLAPQMDRLPDGRSTREAPLLRQVCRFIDLHLAEQDLSAVRLAEQFGLSRAALYRLFEPLEGVNRYVMERRLARVHEVLEREGRRHPMSRIAEEHGFKSPASLSRAFRQRFGYAPITTLPLRAGTTSTDLDRLDDDFARWMRSLGA